MTGGLICIGIGALLGFGIATDALGHRIVSRDEAFGRGPFCCVMRDKFFRQMMDDRASGSKACPFYKMRRMDIRKD